MHDLKAALQAAGLSDDQAAALAEGLDESKFLDATGAIDRGRVAAFADGIPTGARVGHRGEAGRLEAERRFGKPATTEPDTVTTAGGAPGYPKALDAINGAAGLAEARRRFGI